MTPREWVFTHVPTPTIIALCLAIGLGAITMCTYLVRDLAPVIAATTGRQVNWRRVFLILPFALIPYYDASVGFMLLPAILLRAVYLADRAWSVRSLGPERYHQLMLDTIARTSSTQEYLIAWSSAGLTILTGGALWLFSDGPESWSHWFALGIVVYGGISGVERVRRLRRYRPAQIRAGEVPPQ